MTRPLPVEEMNPTATAAETETETEASIKPVMQGKLIVGIILFIIRYCLKRHTIA